MKKEMKGGAE